LIPAGWLLEEVLAPKAEAHHAKGEERISLAAEAANLGFVSGM